MMTCHYCQKDFKIRDLRPYGPKGAYICYSCGQEHHEQTKIGMGIAFGQTVVIGDYGPSSINVDALCRAAMANKGKA